MYFNKYYNINTWLFNWFHFWPLYSHSNWTDMKCFVLPYSLDVALTLCNGKTLYSALTTVRPVLHWICTSHKLVYFVSSFAVSEASCFLFICKHIIFFRMNIILSLGTSWPVIRSLFSTQSHNDACIYQCIGPELVQLMDWTSRQYINQCWHNITLNHKNKLYQIGIKIVFMEIH